ncbi:hypothetical protein OC846_004248 [Tilletia horrida]|uniref:Uncharacterized protein n=1 Tax=Tilletia horrida TaxID=155126 RepID=A0AAN6GN40_9BASI|nr:hypothetical protein OC846_004248 [Tilletia horrida]KAK0549476.1 hypothetical protein OC845_003095 [Tilletia horrida]KAK0568938.1 hypothetical protein OC861_001465 [Tilletia horrida]
MRDPTVLFLDIACYDRKGTQQFKSLRAVAISDLLEEHKKSMTPTSLAGWLTGSHKKSIYDQAAEGARSWTSVAAGSMSLESFERSINDLLLSEQDINGHPDGNLHGFKMQLSWTIPDGYLSKSSELHGRRIVIKHDWDLNAFFKIHEGHGVHHEKIGPAVMEVKCWPKDPQPQSKNSSESATKAQPKSASAATAAPQIKPESGGGQLAAPAIGGVPASSVHHPIEGIDYQPGHHTGRDESSPTARKR